MKTCIFSHPEKLLREHIYNALRIKDRLLEEVKGLKLRLWDFLNLRRFTDVVIAYHDLGKAHPIFQDKLRGKEIRFEHALLGAILAYLFIYRRGLDVGVITPLNLRGEEREQIAELVAKLAFCVIRRHHSHLDSIDKLLYIEPVRIKRSLRLIRELPHKEILQIFSDLELESLVPPLELFHTQEGLNEVETLLVTELRNTLKFKELFSEAPMETYFLLALLFSLLIDPDKLEVVVEGSGASAKEVSLSAEWVEEHVKRLSRGVDGEGGTLEDINILRRRAFKEVKLRFDEFIRSLETEGLERLRGTFVITLPTGMGKTFIGLWLALRIAELKKVIAGVTSRVIYALPYMSLIDQVHKIVNSILRGKDVQLLKHHYLSDLTTQWSDEDPYLSLVFSEGWEQQVIVTTFVQLFEGLLSVYNRRLRRFNKLLNAVVIIDEPQALSPELWSIIREAMEAASESLGITFILLSATNVLYPRRNSFILLDGRGYYEKLSRTVLEYHPEVKSLDELVELLAKVDRALIILNTIRSSQMLYKKLKELGRDVIYLSSSVIPKHRYERIRSVLAGNASLVVTTQVVEAGVDIDFPLVIRDMAPFESILQAAGRCNRHWSMKEKGKVLLIDLRDERTNRRIASYIYSPVLLDATLEILESSPRVIPEERFIDLFKWYLKLLEDREDEEIGERLRRALEVGRIDVLKGFKVIPDDYRVDIFIEADEEAEEIWREYRELISLRGRELLKQRKVNLERLKKRLFSYVVHVSYYAFSRGYVMFPPDTESLLWRVPLDSLSEYYDLELGYKVLERFMEGVMIW